MAAYDPASGTFSDEGFLAVADMTAFRADMLAAIENALDALDYSKLPASLRQLPLGFVLPGKPAPGAVLNLVMGTSCTLPAGLAGSVGYAGQPASASAAFPLRKLPLGGGTPVPLGTVSFAAGAADVSLSGQGAASLSAGDVLQLASPSAQDATLADIGVTILAMRT